MSAQFNVKDNGYTLKTRYVQLMFTMTVNVVYYVSIDCSLAMQYLSIFHIDVLI